MTARIYDFPKPESERQLELFTREECGAIAPRPQPGRVATDLHRTGVELHVGIYLGLQRKIKTMDLPLPAALELRENLNVLLGDWPMAA